MADDLELYIAGEWTEGTGDEALPVRSPVTGQFTDLKTVAIDIGTVQ